MSSRHEDLQLLTRLAVQRLVDDWSRRSWAHRPWGMWLMLWGAIENDEALQTFELPVPLTAAWFLTGSGFVRREEWNALLQVERRVAHAASPALSGPQLPGHTLHGACLVAPALQSQPRCLSLGG